MTVPTDPPAVRDAAEAPSGRISATATLLVAAWIGLVAGFLDLGLVVLKKHAGADFYRLGDAFPWIIPTGVAALVLAPSLVLAASVRRRGVRFGAAVFLPAVVGALDVCARLPLAFWASLLLSTGLAIQCARRLGPRRDAFLRFVGRTTAPLAATVLLLAAATTGCRAWSEYRATAALPPARAGAPNVLLVVWDTVRAKNLSLYGYDRRTTPHLERLAARGVRYEHAFSTSPWTLPSHASFFTGRWPHELSAGWRAPLDGTHATLAERLRALGYDTAGFVANLDYCGRETGLSRGFAHYEDYPVSAWEALTRYVGLGRRGDLFSFAMLFDKLTGGRRYGGRPLVPLSKEHAKGAADIDRGFLRWLSWQRRRHRPFFAFLNYNDAHSPYEVPDDSPRGFGRRPASWRDRLVLQQWSALDKAKLPYQDVVLANDLYDDSIAYLDRRLGALVDDLSRRGVLDNTVVIVVSDHGEHLGDHRLFFHGCSLYRQVVEVPLVIAGPRGVPAGRSVTEPVSLRDLPATVLALVAPGQAGSFPGRPLTRFWDSAGREASPPFEPLLMETDRPTLLTNQGREPAAKGPMKGMVAGGMHYIRSGDGREELFALAIDPEEQDDAARFPEAGETLARFRDALRALLRRPRPEHERTARR